MEDETLYIFKSRVLNELQPENIPFILVTNDIFKLFKIIEFNELQL